jgi:UDP-glucose 4-epimerase
MSLEESVDLVKYAFSEGATGDIFVRKAPGATIESLIEAIRIISGHQAVQTVNIGIRHGEKQHESLLSAEELISAEDRGDYFKIPLDSRSLDYQIYFDEGKSQQHSSEGYTSANTNQLTPQEVADKIKLLSEFNNYKLG